jgi:hypothetical protein
MQPKFTRVGGPTFLSIKLVPVRSPGQQDADKGFINTNPPTTLLSSHRRLLEGRVNHI